jgi:hypothetical protein
MPLPSSACLTVAHEQPGVRVCAVADPAVQGQGVRLPVVPGRIEQDFLVEAVAAGVGGAINKDERFRMTEPFACVAQR